MTKNFIKRQEDFTCEVCKTKVKGTGYTNHCPNCLYSKHVDELVPGDRQSGCGGLMEPVRAETEKGEFILIHKCRKCGKKTRNIKAGEDNFEEILKLF
jgi:hypothetical protein